MSNDKLELAEKFAKKHWKGIYNTSESAAIACLSFLYGECDHYMTRGKCELCDTEDTHRNENGDPYCNDCNNVAVFGYALGAEIVCEEHRYSMGSDSVPIHRSLWFIERYDFVQFDGFSFRATVNGTISPGWSPLAFPGDNEARDEAVKWAKEQGTTDVLILNERGEIIK